MRVSPPISNESSTRKDHRRPGIPGPSAPAEGVTPGEGGHTTPDTKAIEGTPGPDKQGVRCRLCKARLDHGEALYWHWVGIHPREKYQLDRILWNLDEKIKSFQRVCEWTEHEDVDEANQYASQAKAEIVRLGNLREGPEA